VWGRAPRKEDDARIVVVNAKRLRAVQHRMRETHRKLFNLQGDAIVALREALNAVSATHDEMLALFQEVNDLEDEIDDGPIA
jgi:uncharacterized protein Yka (UPF0111/DUF47 family)